MRINGRAAGRLTNEICALVRYFVQCYCKEVLAHPTCVDPYQRQLRSTD